MTDSPCDTHTFAFHKVTRQVTTCATCGGMVRKFQVERHAKFHYNEGHTPSQETGIRPHLLVVVTDDGIHIEAISTPWRTYGYA